MNRPENYNTRQLRAVLGYIASLDGTHVTAAQIVGHFERQSIPISRTTVYRNLEKLVESGEVRKYITDGVSGACFQHVPRCEALPAHFHLKCESCGDLVHLQCDALDEIKEHVLHKHDFEVNATKTVLYGKCNVCLHGGYNNRED